MKDQLFYPTKLKLQVLEHLARFEILTARELSFLVYGDDDHTHITTINKTLAILDTKQHLVNRIYFRPESYLGRGNLPNASGLSAKGVELANEYWPATYPKEFPLTHSPHTIEHDLQRARMHMNIYAMAEDKQWKLGWKKGDNLLVKPDDIFEITAEKTAHFFMESERKKKDFDDLFTKLKAYVDLHGSGKMKEAWGFRWFTVIVPMRSAEAMNNLLVHLQGKCNCIDRPRKLKHATGKFKLASDVLALTTYEDMITRTDQQILHTPSGKTLSLMDFIR